MHRNRMLVLFIPSRLRSVSDGSHVSPILSEQDVRVLPSDRFERRDMVVSSLQPPDDLLGGLVRGVPPFGKERGHDAVQAHDTNPRVIGKCQRAPATCRLGGGSPVLSPLLPVLVVARAVLRRLPRGIPWNLLVSSHVAPPQERLITRPGRLRPRPPEMLSRSTHGSQGRSFHSLRGGSCHRGHGAASTGGSHPLDLQRYAPGVLYDKTMRDPFPSRPSPKSCTSAQDRTGCLEPVPRQGVPGTDQEKAKHPPPDRRDSFIYQKQRVSSFISHSTPSCSVLPQSRPCNLRGHRGSSSRPRRLPPAWSAPGCKRAPLRWPRPRARP